MIQQFIDTLAPPRCDDLVQLADALTARSSTGEAASVGPAIHLLGAGWDVHARASVLEALQACIRQITVQPTINAETIYAETIALTMLSPGDQIPWHADNCQLDGQGRWVPSSYRQRCLSALLYLNEDFEGGEIVFDQQGLAIKPRTGLLVAFPSDHQYTHRVNAVVAGRRYALAMWFTVHRWHALLSQRISVRPHG